MTASHLDASDLTGQTDAGPAADPTRDAVHDAARRARSASRELALLTADRKNALLQAAADALVVAESTILEANARDLAEQSEAGMGEAMLDRLRLTAERIEGIADGLRQVSGLADPVGTVTRGSTRPNGLQLRQVRVPLGVVGMIYEGRPNVTVDAFGLANAPTAHWCVDGSPITVEAVREAHLRWYSAHPDAVAAGLARHADALALLGLAGR